MVFAAHLGGHLTYFQKSFFPAIFVEFHQFAAFFISFQKSVIFLILAVSSKKGDICSQLNTTRGRKTKSTVRSLKDPHLGSFGHFLKDLPKRCPGGPLKPLTHVRASKSRTTSIVSIGVVIICSKTDTKYLDYGV